jgi:hypothetical protein
MDEEITAGEVKTIKALGPLHTLKKHSSKSRNSTVMEFF